ncbi:hypothetical protein JHU04_001250 [Brenneria sp. 4F2]|nr:hypothetical protein [Brenneria bubanii]
MKNQIIKFPFPLWDNITNSDSLLICKPYCICFRSDFSESSEGDFGFKNEKACLFFNELLKRIILIKENNIELMKKNMPTESGLYLYDDDNIFKSLEKELLFYLKNKKKNELLLKRGQEGEKIEMPLILNVHSTSGYDIEIVNHAIENSYPFFLRCFYTPQAGESLVFFNDNFDAKIKKLSLSMDIDYMEVSTMNNIPYL